MFLLDLAFLETIGRVLSLVCLRLILIGAPYLYPVYGEMLRSFTLAQEPAGEAAAPGNPPAPSEH